MSSKKLDIGVKLNTVSNMDRIITDYLKNERLIDPETKRSMEIVKSHLQRIMEYICLEANNTGRQKTYQAHQLNDGEIN